MRRAAGGCRRASVASTTARVRNGCSASLRHRLSAVLAPCAPAKRYRSPRIPLTSRPQASGGALGPKRLGGVGVSERCPRTSAAHHRRCRFWRTSGISPSRTRADGRLTPGAPVSASRHPAFQTAGRRLRGHPTQPFIRAQAHMH
jgi:hypothetical protein